jgi:flagellar hook-associated protein 1 FlgK
MSLFGTLQMASNTLQAMQVGLHVVGNNIANANTPGFIREEVIYAPAPVQRRGNLVLGLGVQVEAIVQQVDRFLQDRIRGASSDTAGASVQQRAYADLEALLGELGDTDISTSLSDFFNSVDAVLEAPGDVSLRNLVVLRGQTLAQRVNRLHDRAVDVHQQFDFRIGNIESDINRLTEELRNLNVRIVQAEGGGAISSEAGALRAARDVALSELAGLIDITATEQTTGAVTVSIGGEFIVNDAIRREVEVRDVVTGDLNAPRLHFSDTGAQLRVTSGEVGGLYQARDSIVGGFIDTLDQFAGTLAWEFNRLHTQGQGLVGFEHIESQNAVANPAAALDAAGLPFTPANGSFDILIRNTNTGVTQTHTIVVDLNGLDQDMSLADLASAINGITGLTASATPSGRLQIGADAAATEFAFARDSSGVLASLGLNTFFGGSTAGDLHVNENLVGIQNARRFAASAGGIGEDTAIAEQMADFYDRPLESLQGASLFDSYTQLVSDLSQGATVAKSVADGLRQFGATLEGEQLAITGVSVDEEAVKMIQLQRTFQASAKLISTISEMLDTLVNL